MLMLWGMNEPAPAATLAILAVTCVVSFIAFNNRAFMERLIFSPERVLRDKEGYRIITSAFLHGDFGHLFFNMYSLYLFGRAIELNQGVASFLFIYFSAIIGGGLLSLFLHRHHVYRALGASGGVCGIIFAYIFLFPHSGIGMIFLPFYVPGWLYAIFFLLYSFYSMKRGKDNVGHDAHLGGAIIGLLVTTALYPEIARENPGLYTAVLVISLGVLVYIVRNPLFLPMRHFQNLNDESYRKPAPPIPRKPQTENVDAILEKIAQSGIHSLSKSEHEALERASRRRRDNS
jgi:membrane associated rhomboid family serine protease